MTTNLAPYGMASVFSGAKIAGALLDRLTHHRDNVETDSESWRFKKPRRVQAP